MVIAAVIYALRVQQHMCGKDVAGFGPAATVSELWLYAECEPTISGAFGWLHGSEYYCPLPTAAPADYRG